MSIQRFHKQHEILLRMGLLLCFRVYVVNIFFREQVLFLLADFQISL